MVDQIPKGVPSTNTISILKPSSTAESKPSKSCLVFSFAKTTENSKTVRFADDLIDLEVETHWDHNTMKAFFQQQKLAYPKPANPNTTGITEQLVHKVRYKQNLTKSLSEFTYHPEGDPLLYPQLPLIPPLERILADVKGKPQLVKLRKCLQIVLRNAPYIFSVIHPFDEQTIMYLNSMGRQKGHPTRPQVVSKHKSLMHWKGTCIPNTDPLFVPEYHIPPALEEQLLMHRLFYFMTWFLKQRGNTKDGDWSLFGVVNDLMDMKAYNIVLKRPFKNYFPLIDETSFAFYHQLNYDIESDNSGGDDSDSDDDYLDLSQYITNY